MKALLDRLFGIAEEINGHEICPTYLYRWTLFGPRNCKVYLHHFVGDDWSRDLHDHPKRFISIGLWGSYIEETPSGERHYRAPWIRTFPAEHVHRLRLGPHRDCWTLVIVLKAVRLWGFWHNGQWIYWRDYVGSEQAERRKSCP